MAEEIGGAPPDPVGTRPTKPGFYPDPYDSKQIRWFDGTEWTTHAVPASTPHPDEVVAKHSSQMHPDAPEEWKAQFPQWDPAIPRGDEPPFNMAGGVDGFYANRTARLIMRQKKGPFHPARLLTGLTLVLALLAWGDRSQRLMLLVVAAAVAAVAVILEVRMARTKKHWKQVGNE